MILINIKIDCLKGLSYITQSVIKCLTYLFIRCQNLQSWPSFELKRLSLSAFLLLSFYSLTVLFPTFWLVYLTFAKGGYASFQISLQPLWANHFHIESAFIFQDLFPD